MERPDREGGADDTEVLEDHSGVAATVPQPSRREADDDYPIIARINDNTRVIACKDGIQWIIQGLSGGRWRGVSYCRSRHTLIVRCREYHGPLAPEALELLKALPEWFIERGKGTA
jgi:hypothetical protein